MMSFVERDVGCDIPGYNPTLTTQSCSSSLNKRKLGDPRYIGLAHMASTLSRIDLYVLRPFNQIGEGEARRVKRLHRELVLAGVADQTLAIRSHQIVKQAAC